MGDFRHHGHLGRALRGLGHEELLQSLLVEVADAPEEIELKGGHGNVRAVDVRDDVPAGGGHLARRSLRRFARDSRNGGQELPAAHVVLSPSRPHVVHRGTQVAVVLKSDGDQLLHALIGEELAPVGKPLDQQGGVLGCLVKRPGLGNRRLGPFIAGRKVHAARKHHRRRKRQHTESLTHVHSPSE